MKKNVLNLSGNRALPLQLDCHLFDPSSNTFLQGGGKGKNGQGWYIQERTELFENIIFRRLTSHLKTSINMTNCWNNVCLPVTTTGDESMN